MTDLFVMKGEPMTWFVNKECGVEGLAVRRNDIFAVHISNVCKSDIDISGMAMDGISVNQFKGKIFLADSKRVIICEPFDGVLPGSCICLLQQIVI